MGLFDIIKGNARAVDPAKLRQEMADILLDDEQIHRAFVLVRDLIVMTDKRLLFVDKQGVSGKKTEYKSIPYSKITSFSAETAGFLDGDAELKLWIGSSPTPMLIQVSRAVPIRDIYKTLSWFVLK